MNVIYRFFFNLASSLFFWKDSDVDDDVGC